MTAGPIAPSAASGVIVTVTLPRGTLSFVARSVRVDVAPLVVRSATT